MELRDYQQEALKEIKDALSSGKKAPLLVLPTGAGKTVVFTELSKYLINQDKRVLILVHRKELVKQTCEKLDQINTKYGVIAPFKFFKPSTNNLLQVASVYTLHRRMHNIKFTPDYIIIDEAHHIAAKTWNDVIRKYKKAQRIGVTATPIRLDGKSLKDYFDVLINGPSIIDLVNQGYLCNHKVYGSPHALDFSNLKLKNNDYLKKDIANLVKNKVITGNAVSHYKKYLLNKPTVVFCVDIPHAQTILDRFLSEGIKAALLTGDTPQNERDKILDDLKNNIIHVVVSIDVISEGTDLPCVEGAILLRPTNSESLYRQQVGRILRPGENKTAIVLDHVNNTLIHGFVDEKREWELKEQEIFYGQKKRNPLVRTCQQCNHVFQFAKSCPECGFELSKKELIEVEGELEELKNVISRKKRGRKAARQIHNQTRLIKARRVESLSSLGIRVDLSTFNKALNSQTYATYSELAKLIGVSRSAISQKKKNGFFDHAIINVKGRQLINLKLIKFKPIGEIRRKASEKKTNGILNGTTFTFREAGKLLGYKSPSTLYKLKREEKLDDYVIDIEGRSYLVMKPAGKPKLKDYLVQILQFRTDGVMAHQTPSLLKC